MGLVYRARQRRPDRIVAIKVIAPELAADPAFRARFEQESATAAEIEHPNVIPVYEVGDDDGLLFISMRFVHGVDLGRLLTETRPAGPGARRRPDLAGRGRARRRACSRAGPPRREAGQHPRDRARPRLSDGLRPDEAHDRLARDDADRDVRRDGRLHRARAGGGPPARRARGRLRARVRAYELLSGTVPFPRDSDVAKIFAHVNDPPPRLREVSPSRLRRRSSGRWRSGPRTGSCPPATSAAR